MKFLEKGKLWSHKVETDRNSVSVPKTTILTVSASFVFGRTLIDDFRQRFGFGRKSSTGFGGVPKVRTALTIYDTDQTGQSPDGLQWLHAPADRCHYVGHYSPFRLQKCLSVYPVTTVSIVNFIRLQPIRRSGQATLPITCVTKRLACPATSAPTTACLFAAETDL